MDQKLLKLTAFLPILIVALASSCQPEEPKEIEYTILPTSLNFDATGGEDKFTVTVTSPATVESIESLSAWCQVSTSGVSPVHVMVTVDPYTYYEARNTTVVVHMKLGENKTSVAVPITQAGVEIPEWVLIDGIKWATRNVDMPGTFTAKPEDPGMFYQWNRKVGWSATDPMINSDGGTTWDASNSEHNTWEKASDPCPPGWRVPTNTELYRLGNVDNEWTTVNSVNGYMFGCENDALFLPAAGYRRGTDGMLRGLIYEGLYWSSRTGGSSTHAYCFYVYGEQTPMFFYPHTYAFNVRCVAE